MGDVTMDLLYKELLSLKKDVAVVKSVLISEEKVSTKELAEIESTKKEMVSGKEKSMKAVFGC
jgi:hypothetical protein